jgi:hypothetical protein
MSSTPALAHHLPPPAPSATRPSRPALRLVPPPRGERRLAPAQRVASLGLGLVIGFLLVAAASLPLGVDAAAADARWAAVAAVAVLPALLRSRALARRERRRARPTSARRSSSR